jgi:hypothetical protein
MTMTKRRSPRAVKFTVSMPASDFTEIESARGKAGKSRSRFLRDAVLGERGLRPGDAGRGSVREDRAPYGSPDLESVTDAAELRTRARAAAGAFSSGVPDLSSGHDRYRSDPPPERGRRTPGRDGKDEREP